MNEFLQNVVEVQTVQSDVQVNKLLSEGWKLIHVGTYSRFYGDYVESGTEFTLAQFQ